MYCKSCGKALIEGAGFCGGCGAAVGGVVVAPPAPIAPGDSPSSTVEAAVIPPAPVVETPKVAESPLAWKELHMDEPLLTYLDTRDASPGNQLLFYPDYYVRLEPTSHGSFTCYSVPYRAISLLEHSRYVLEKKGETTAFLTVHIAGTKGNIKGDPEVIADLHSWMAALIVRAGQGKAQVPSLPETLAKLNYRG